MIMNMTKPDAVYKGGAMNQSIASYILNSKYHLKNEGVKKSKWRKMIAKAFVSWKKDKGFNADDFVNTWEYLDKQGLLE